MGETGIIPAGGRGCSEEAWEGLEEGLGVGLAVATGEVLGDTEGVGRGACVCEALRGGGAGAHTRGLNEANDVGGER